MTRVVNKRTLLHDERSVVIQPEMVRRLGNLADAAVLQQLNYWMPHAKVEHQGRMWVYKSYDNLGDEIGLTGQQVRRSIERLEDAGLVSSCVPRGRTKHYAVNYDHALLDGANPPDTYQANSPDDAANSPDNQANSPTNREVTETQGDNTLAAAPRQRKPDLLWDAMVEACGINTATLTKNERGRINEALKQLREVSATPDDIRRKAAAYRKTWPDVSLTPTALVSHWSTLESKPGRVSKPKCECGQPFDAHDEEFHEILLRGGY